jgi:quercetin dioxygenase-like cupin family protein
MIVRSADNSKRTFRHQDIDFILMSHEPGSMAVKMVNKKDDHLKIHKHPNEEIGYIASGIYRLVITDDVRFLCEGDSYSIPANTPHTVEIIEPGEVVIFFSPPREDYLSALNDLSVLVNS